MPAVSGRNQMVVHDLPSQGEIKWLNPAVLGRSKVDVQHQPCRGQLKWLHPPPPCASTRKVRKVTVRPGPSA